MLSRIPTHKHLLRTDTCYQAHAEIKCTWTYHWTWFKKELTAVFFFFFSLLFSLLNLCCATRRPSPTLTWCCQVRNAMKQLKLSLKQFHHCVLKNAQSIFIHISLGYKLLTNTDIYCVYVTNTVCGCDCLLRHPFPACDRGGGSCSPEPSWGEACDLLHWESLLWAHTWTQSSWPWEYSSHCSHWTGMNNCNIALLWVCYVCYLVPTLIRIMKFHSSCGKLLMTSQSHKDKNNIKYTVENTQY